MPQQGETRTANGETRQWDGGGWVLLGGTADPGGHTSEPWNAEDTKNTTNAFKAFMGLGGATVGSVLGPAGTVAGGAVGRAIGHIPEALVERTTGKPSGSTFMDEGITGGEEGVASELAPTALWGGAKVLGKTLGGVTRSMIPPKLAEWLPTAVTDAGKSIEGFADRFGPRTLSQRVRKSDAIQSLMGDEPEIAQTIKNSPVTPRAKWNDAEEVPYRAGSGRSDAFSEQAPKLDVRADSWPSNEPVFGDVRPELANVDLARAALDKEWNPKVVRRVIMESPSGPYEDLLKRGRPAKPEPIDLATTKSLSMQSLLGRK